MKTNYRLTKEKYLDDEEQIHLTSVLKRFEKREPRNTTLFYLALNCGARATELLNLKAMDLDHRRKTVYIRGIKNSNDRDIPLPTWLFKKLSEITKDKDPQDDIFPISYSRLVQIWGDYRPVKKKFHSLRHTFAINVYRKSKDIKLLQMALGHRSWKNTMIYSDYQYSVDEMRKLLL